MKILNFRFLVTTLFFFNISFHSFSQKNEIKVKGKINNNIYTTVFLLEYDKNIKKIDSTNFTKTGEFSFKTNISHTAVYQLKLSDTTILMLVLSPGENITINTDSKDLIGKFSIKGSPNTKLIYDTQKEIQKFSTKVDSLNTIYLENQNKPNINDILPELQKQYNTIMLAQRNLINMTILNNLHSLSCLFFIDKLDIVNDVATYIKLDSVLFKDYPNNVFVEELHNKVSVATKLSVGSLAPEINLADSTGKFIALSSLKGKIVLIDFWASWCGPCKKEMPNMKKIYAKYKDKGFEIYGVSLDKYKNSWTNYIAKDSLNWIQVSDLKYWQSETASMYDVKAIPFTYLIDREGKILGKGLRGEALEAKLEEIFK